MLEILVFIIFSMLCGCAMLRYAVRYEQWCVCSAYCTVPPVQPSPSTAQSLSVWSSNLVSCGDLSTLGLSSPPSPSHPNEKTKRDARILQHSKRWAGGICASLPDNIRRTVNNRFENKKESFCSENKKKLCFSWFLRSSWDCDIWRNIHKPYVN